MIPKGNPAVNGKTYKLPKLFFLPLSELLWPVLIQYFLLIHKNGYKIVFATNTVIMNYKFAAAAAQYGTKENRIIRNVRHDFPDMTETVVSGREKRTPQANTRLTYQNMETHIRSYENADALLAAFETAKARSAPLASPYKYVTDWFRQQFPNYAQAVTDEQHTGTITLIPLPDVETYKARA